MDAVNVELIVKDELVAQSSVVVIDRLVSGSLEEIRAGTSVSEVLPQLHGLYFRQLV